jgi:hypothetical protein
MVDKKTKTPYSRDVGISIKETVHSSKTMVVLEIIRRKMREVPGRKIIVFGSWTSAMITLGRLLTMDGYRCVHYDGRTPPNKRSLKLNMMRDNQGDVLLCTYGAGGISINMQFADVVILFDQCYNNSAENQAIDRARRIGQDKKVEIYKIVASGTLEKWMLGLKQEKSVKEADWNSGKSMESWNGNETSVKRMLSFFTNGAPEFMCNPNKAVTRVGVSSGPGRAGIENNEYEYDSEDLDPPKQSDRTPFISLRKNPRMCVETMSLVDNQFSVGDMPRVVVPDLFKKKHTAASQIVPLSCEVEEICSSDEEYDAHVGTPKLSGNKRKSAGSMC